MSHQQKPSQPAASGRAGETPPAGHQDLPAARQGAFPAVRMRRNRKANWSRLLVGENSLSAADLIWPLFVTEGVAKRTAVATMPGVERLSIDLAVEAAREAAALGIPAIALFPFTDPKLRTEDAREAFNPDNLVCRATRAIKDAKLDIGVILDVALDPYTSHGHDGLLRDGEIVNDATVAVLVGFVVTSVLRLRRTRRHLAALEAARSRPKPAP